MFGRSERELQQLQENADLASMSAALRPASNKNIDESAYSLFELNIHIVCGV
jgi:hypothetical protein